MCVYLLFSLPKRIKLMPNYGLFKIIYILSRTYQHLTRGKHKEAGTCRATWP